MCSAEKTQHGVWSVFSGVHTLGYRLETLLGFFFYYSFKTNRNLIWYLCVLKKNFLGTLCLSSCLLFSHCINI